MKKLDLIRKKYPKFIYESYSYRISNNDLEISFSFKIPPSITFHPKITIKNPPKNLQRTVLCKLGNLIFHLGLIEMFSYWKATVSPTIEIRAGYLDDKQIKWWKDLIIKGMGQFFYENKINWKKKDFLKMTVSPARKRVWRGLASPNLERLGLSNSFPDNGYLVPFAGGRDSIITLESLKEKGEDVCLFTVNPIEKIENVIKVSDIKKRIVVLREIDKKLLELNKKGFLNGHTPFTSMLSFLAVLCAVIFDYKHIAFSNEKSANEGNVKYLGKTINHQWAKSFEFEKMFKVYARKYLVKDIDYFSYIRKHSELEISKMLSKYPKYFPVFSSCNAGMRISAKGTLAAKSRWCGKCPKCLFVFLSIYPFISEKQSIEIFGKNLLKDKSLKLLLEQLIGKRGIKPFECIGTIKEAKKAYNLCLKKLGN